MAAVSILIQFFRGDGNLAGFEQQVKMVGNRRPGAAPGFALRNDLTQATQEIVTVFIIAENLPALDNVVQGPRSVYSGLSYTELRSKPENPVRAEVSKHERSGRPSIPQGERSLNATWY